MKFALFGRTSEENEETLGFGGVVGGFRSLAAKKVPAPIGVCREYQGISLDTGSLTTASTARPACSNLVVFAKSCGGFAGGAVAVPCHGDRRRTIQPSHRLYWRGHTFVEKQGRQVQRQLK
jgi:hypothetical protein